VARQLEEQNLFPDFTCTLSPELHVLPSALSVPPVPQVFHIPKRKRVSNVHHHRQADDLGRRFEVPENAGVAHAVRLAALPSGGNPIFL
jgi:hypothetical protein